MLRRRAAETIFPGHLKSIVLFAICLIGALVVLWPATLRPGGFLYPPGAEYSDLTISHWPNAVYFRRSVLGSGQWPLWNSTILAGAPFAADPLSGLWYPPNLLFLIVHPTLGFNLLLILHLGWTGWGAFQLARNQGLAPGPASFVSVAWAANPKLIAHIGAGHVSLAFAVAWTPWLMIGVRQAFAARRWSGGVPAAVVLALIFLADVRWAFYAGVLALACWTWMILSRKEERFAATRHVAALLTFGVLFLLLGAVSWLPLQQFLSLTGRVRLSAGDAAIFSLPPVYLLGAVIPFLGVVHEWMTYLGFAPLLLTVVALWLVPAAQFPRKWFWFGAAGLAAIFSLGDNVFLFGLLVRFVPGLSLLRVPARAWFIVSFATSLLAGWGLAALASPALTGGRKRLLSMGAVGGIGGSWLLAGSAVLIGGSFTNRFALATLWTAIVASLVLGSVLGRMRQRLLPGAFAVVLVLTTLADLSRVNATVLESRPEEVVFGPKRPLAAFFARPELLCARPGPFRIYSPSYSLPQQVAAEAGLDQADGINPLQLAETVAYMSLATGVPDMGYTVTLPPFASGDPTSDNRAAIPDPRLLGMLNVRYVVAEFDLDVPELRYLQTFGATRVYLNEAARGQAWLTSSVTPVEDAQQALQLARRGLTAIEGGVPLIGEEHGGEVSAVRTPNQITLQATAVDRALLVLSEVWYPGWVATVDGQEVPIYRVNGLLRGVYLEPGAHTIVLRFLPPRVFPGLLLSLTGVVLAGLITLWVRRGARQGLATPAADGFS